MHNVGHSPWINFSTIWKERSQSDLPVSSSGLQQTTSLICWVKGVYKGVFSNVAIVAVKVLHGNPDKIIEDQLKAEVSTIGRVHHI